MTEKPTDGCELHGGISRLILLFGSREQSLLRKIDRHSSREKEYYDKWQEAKRQLEKEIRVNASMKMMKEPTSSHAMTEDSTPLDSRPLHPTLPSPVKRTNCRTPLSDTQGTASGEKSVALQQKQNSCCEVDEFSGGKDHLKETPKKNRFKKFLLDNSGMPMPLSPFASIATSTTSSENKTKLNVRCGQIRNDIPPPRKYLATSLPLIGSPSKKGADRRLSDQENANIHSNRIRSQPTNKSHVDERGSPPMNRILTETPCEKVKVTFNNVETAGDEDITILSSSDEDGSRYFRKIHLKRKSENAVRKAEKRKSLVAAIEINPDQNKGETLHYQEVVRNKEARKSMHAGTCSGCSGYYERATGKTGPRCQHEVGAEEDKNFSARKRKAQDRLQDTSRHRQQHRFAEDPPDFWQLGFPSTPMVNKINQKAEQMRVELREYQEDQANSNGGFYQYRTA